MCEVPLANSAEVRLREAASLPEVLDEGFAAFEAIRITARAYEAQVPATVRRVHDDRGCRGRRPRGPDHRAFPPPQRQQA